MPTANVFTRAGTSLKVSRDFRFLWISNLLFIGANWCLILVLSWLVFETTDSELLLAIFTAVRLSPMWLGPVSGLLADRYDRVLLIRIASLWAFGCTALLAVLTWLEFTPFWLLVLAGLLTGLSQSPSQPARSSLTLQLVGRAHLANANAVNAMGFGVTGAVTPALGGIILADYGVTVSLLYTSAWYLAAAAAMWAVRSGRRVTVRVAHEPVISMIRGGLRLILPNRLTVSVLVITLASNILIWPIYNSFLPVFASDVLSLGPDGLGQLMMFYGFGGFIGSFVIASLGDFRAKGAMFVIGSVVWGAGWAMFGISESAGISYALIFGIGLVSSAFAVLQATLMLITSAAEVQGRALGILELAIGAMPIGTLLLGWSATGIGVGMTTFLAGVIFVAMVIAHTLRVPDLLRSMDEPESATT